MSHLIEPLGQIDWTWGEVAKDKFEISGEVFIRVKHCVDACIGLTDPEKQIKALVDAARKSLYYMSNSIAFGILESALKPFKEKIK